MGDKSIFENIYDRKSLGPLTGGCMTVHTVQAQLRLSICIPTYNFGAFIGQTLDSILPQLTDDIEIIILDGGSTDNTSEVVSVRQRAFPQIAYYKQATRGGIGRDIEKVISYARGQYCWLFSADDIMLPGALTSVLRALGSEFDIYVNEHVSCTFDMRPVQRHPPFENISAPRLFDLSDSLQRKEYFCAARTSEAFFSFLSGPIFKRDIWDKSSKRIPDSLRNSVWIVSVYLLNAFLDGIKVFYMKEILLHKRGDNDSFLLSGFAHRYGLAIYGYREIADLFFGHDSLESHHIRRSIQCEITLKHLLNAKLDCAENKLYEDIVELDRMVSIHYSDAQFFIRFKLWIYKYTPLFLYRFLKDGKKFLKLLAKRS